MTFDKLPRCPVCDQPIRLDQSLYRYTPQTAERRTGPPATHGFCGALDAADRGEAEPLLAG